MTFAISRANAPKRDRPYMSLEATEAARRRVLMRLGLDRLVTVDYLDIADGHRALAAAQMEPASFVIDGMSIDAPAGVYHPTPESSSLLFIHNIQALAAREIPRMLEIGTGTGAIALYVARHWGGYVLATDVSAHMLDVARANAERNGLTPCFVQSDLWQSIDEGDFNLVVFNTPLIDKAPEDDLERESLCDPGGKLLRGYLDGLPRALKPDGIALFGICCNTAYQQMDEVDLDFRVVGLELIGQGFWRAIVAARRTRR